jgi:hypothetical protein
MPVDIVSQSANYRVDLPLGHFSVGGEGRACTLECLRDVGNRVRDFFGREIYATGEPLKHAARDKAVKYGHGLERSVEFQYRRHELSEGPSDVQGQTRTHSGENTFDHQNLANAYRFRPELFDTRSNACSAFPILITTLVCLNNLRAFRLYRGPLWTLVTDAQGKIRALQSPASTKDAVIVGEHEGVLAPDAISADTHPRRPASTTSSPAPARLDDVATSLALGISRLMARFGADGSAESSTGLLPPNERVSVSESGQ